MQWSASFCLFRVKLPSCLVKRMYNSIDQRTLSPFIHRHTIDRALSTTASMAESSSRIAVAQMTSTDRMDENFSTCSRLAEEAVAAGAKILFLPENFNYLGRSPSDSLKIAESLDGPIIARYASLARRLKLWLSLGGFQEKSKTHSDKLHNCHVVLDHHGEIAAYYRKIHLFNVDIPNGPVLMEGNFTAPGTGLVTCDSPVGRLGLSVCYDLRFPMLYQRLAFTLGAKIMLVPSAFTVTTGEAHWEVLLRARAIETQSYVVAAAQAGRHNEKRESYGHSIVVDPWGTVIARLPDPKATGIAIADVDLDGLEALRRRMPVAEHRVAGEEAVGGQTNF